MKIGVISDTHIPKAAAGLPEEVCKSLEGVELILHAGDLTELGVLDRLKKIAPVKAVYGNMDDIEVQKLLPRKEIIEVGKFRIGLVHGSGPPLGLEERVRKEFDKVDIIIFGHSHSPINQTKDGILFFNPGSPTDKVFARLNSYGILEINEEVKAHIIKL